MPFELKVPEVGESITEVEIGVWLKAEGDYVEKDENVVTIESEKATVELPAPVSGIIAKILKQKGQTAAVGEVICQMEKTDGPPEKKSEKQQQPKPAETAPSPPRQGPRAEATPVERAAGSEDARPTASGGRLPKDDSLPQVEDTKEPESKETSAVPPPQRSSASAWREEEVVPMSPLRRTVAERLVAAQQSAALLTTFNEIDMSAVIELRKQCGESFLAKYQVKLGFMSFFVKAVIDALKLVPQVNAEVRGTNIAYRNYFDIGVAIGSGKGLVVPVLRNAERMGFAEIEVAIGSFAARAKENKLKLEELQGGTFTITNGGVYGSLLSTPIVNPPQSGILGMHAIQDRPVAHAGTVVIRPMMYVALTYDHRIVDGREAVTFLKRVKETIENPARMLIEV